MIQALLQHTLIDIEKFCVWSRRKFRGEFVKIYAALHKSSEMNPADRSADRDRDFEDQLLIPSLQKQHGIVFYRTSLG
jgi:hypothetical protein